MESESSTKIVMPNAIVVEVLNKYNYEQWSELVQTYLIAQDLWPVVESDDHIMNESPNDKQIKISEDIQDQNPLMVSHPSDHRRHHIEFYNYWKTDKKNAAALHAIKISCGPQTLPAIKKIRSAKEAWETLEDKFKPRILVEFSNYQGVDDHQQDKEAFFGALQNSEWETVKNLSGESPQLLTLRLPRSRLLTALHVAVEDKAVDVVRHMVGLLSEKDLETTDCNGWTPLASTALTGNIDIAQTLIKKNPSLLCIPDNSGNIPIVLALCFGHTKMVRFMFESHNPEEALVILDNGKHGATLVSKCISMQTSEALRIAIKCLKRFPKLAIAIDNNGNSPVYTLACAHYLFFDGVHLTFWQKWIYDCIHTNYLQRLGSDELDVKSTALDSFGRRLGSKLLSMFPGKFKRLRELKLVHHLSTILVDYMCNVIQSIEDEETFKEGLVFEAIFAAVDRGNIEFIERVTDAKKALFGCTDEHSRDIFMRGVASRREEIFRILQVGGTDEYVYPQLAALEDKFGNNLLHMAALLAPATRLNSIPGAALQMQRELQWYKAVQDLLPSTALTTENSDNMTPDELFTENHKHLVSDGEKWMKETATSCSVVAALIVTIMFSAAYTVPGGENQSRKLYNTLIISDGISLFCSTASMLVFLGILTTRYEQGDFLVSLPTKMIVGLSTLFLSTATMMISFSVVLLLMLHKSWFVIPLILLASLPVTLFVFMQYPLLVVIYRSTYGESVSLTPDHRRK